MSDDPGDDMLGWDESVFRNEHVFEIDYLPETFKHRETQMETLKYALRPAVRGSPTAERHRPRAARTGKTTATQILFDELRAQTEVQAVRVNCQVDSTRYAVFSRLFAEIFDYEPRRRASPSRSSFRRSPTASSSARRCSWSRWTTSTTSSTSRKPATPSTRSCERTRPTPARGSGSLASPRTWISTSSTNSARPERLPTRGSTSTSTTRPKSSTSLRERVDRGFHEGAVGTQVLDRVARVHRGAGR